MKTIISIATIAVLAIYVSANLLTEEDISTSEKLDYKFVKCTPAKFVLSGIDSTKQISPLFEGLGNLSFTISTTHARAQAYFNQGLKLTYAFNHAEAHRSFMEASRLDPNSAMAYWGQALALGPNINDPMPSDERKVKCNEAIAKAQSLAYRATPKEQDLIAALSKRYSTDLTQDISVLNLSYMNAMARVMKKFSEDDNILILYAASAMNTVPWNYWDANGDPSPNIEDAKASLEYAMKINPNNPGAHHYYIHMVELPMPDLGVPSAEKLGSLMPSAGHIVHMPSHIYIRVGRYKEAVEVNQAAILADEDYITQCYAQGSYPLGYYPHNIHFLWSAASLLGDSEIAIDAAKKTAEKVPVGELVEMPFLQDFAATPLLAYARFGKWNEILTIPEPSADIKHLRVIRHYTRGLAFLRKGNIAEAQEELDAMAKLKEDPELDNLIATPHNSTLSILNIAYEVVAGELAAQQGNLDQAIAHLEKAVRLEDDLTYTEPAAWHIPTRQNLGNILMIAKKYEEAEKRYKEDLSLLRQNGWSLIGLYNAYLAQGKTVDAHSIKHEFDEAWKHADIEIIDSVL